MDRVQIEKLRCEMYELINTCGYKDARVLAKSEELDKEINVFMLSSSEAGGYKCV